MNSIKSQTKSFCIRICSCGSKLNTASDPDVLFCEDCLKDLNDEESGTGSKRLLEDSDDSADIVYLDESDLATMNVSDFRGIGMEAKDELDETSSSGMAPDDHESMDNDSISKEKLLIEGVKSGFISSLPERNQQIIVAPSLPEYPQEESYSLAELQEDLAISPDQFTKNPWTPRYDFLEFFKGTIRTMNDQELRDLYQVYQSLDLNDDSEASCNSNAEEGVEGENSVKQREETGGVELGLAEDINLPEENRSLDTEASGSQSEENSTQDKAEKAVEKPGRFVPNTETEVKIAPLKEENFTTTEATNYTFNNCFPEPEEPLPIYANQFEDTSDDDSGEYIHSSPSEDFLTIVTSDSSTSTEEEPIRNPTLSEDFLTCIGTKAKYKIRFPKITADSNRNSNYVMDLVTGDFEVPELETSSEESLDQIPLIERVRRSLLPSVKATSTEGSGITNRPTPEKDVVRGSPAKIIESRETFYDEDSHIISGFGKCRTPQVVFSGDFEEDKENMSCLSNGTGIPRKMAAFVRQRVDLFEHRGHKGPKENKVGKNAFIWAPNRYTSNKKY